MTQAIRITAESDHDLRTILSDRVMIPVTCDHCDKDTDISLETLKTTSTVMCEHCYQVRPFSSGELQVLTNLLSRSGYRVTA